MLFAMPNDPNFTKIPTMNQTAPVKLGNLFNFLFYFNLSIIVTRLFTLHLSIAVLQVSASKLKLQDDEQLRIFKEI